MITFDRKKDKVAIIAPSSGYRDDKGNLDPQAGNAQLGMTISLFKEYGFSCIYDEKIFVGGSLEYFAAPKEERLRQLKDAIENPEVKIISMVRGGYGAGEIVFDCLKVVPSCGKILIGFSDVTVLHFLFNQHYKLPSIHGAVRERSKDKLENLVSILEGKPASFPLRELTSDDTHEETKTQGKTEEVKIQGKTAGGNLTLICNMIGTKLHPEFAGKILLLEDVNEKAYQVHRHLLHMYTADLFEQVKAVIFYDFTKSDHLLDATIKHFTHDYLNGIPVFRAEGIGHGEVNYPITLGGEAVINDSMLTVESPFGVV